MLRRLLLGLVVVATVWGGESPGARSPEAAVERYLRAVERGDPGAAFAVVPNADRVPLRAHVTAFAGNDARTVAVTIAEPIKGPGRAVWLRFPDGREDGLSVVPDGGRWYVRFPAPAECLPGAVCLTD